MAKTPLKHQAYEAIKDNIINCIYAPGAIINEELIQEEINASRTPIRDALGRLEQEGLVRILPKKGIYVSGLSAKELNMIYETRNLLEPYAVLHYGSHISQEIYLNYYHMYISYLDNPRQEYSFRDMDDKFHQLFIESTNNSYFISMYSTIDSQIRRTRVLSGHTSYTRLQNTVKEHLAIVQEAIKNNWSEAAEAMRYHLDQSKNVAFQHIFEKDSNFPIEKQQITSVIKKKK